VVIGHELRFGPPKTASGDARVVDLDHGTVGALLGHRLAQDAERAAWGPAYADHGLVFARENGEPLHPETVTKRFGKLAEAASLRPVRLHDLWHGQASLMLAAGVPLAVVSKRLGHSSVSITSDTYSHLLEGVGREAAERAAALVPRNRRERFVSTVDSRGQSAGGRSEESPAQRGGAPGDRTRNPRIKSPLLCQLS
jgi:integrase